MKTHTHIFLFTTLSALSIVRVQGDELLHYTFASGSADPTTEAANVEGGTISYNGLTGGFSGSSNSAFITFANTPDDFNSSAYLEFTISAASGYELNLDSMSFNLVSDNKTGSEATVYANVRSNEDAYGADLIMNPGAVTTASHTSSSGFTGTVYTTDLSGTQFDNISSLTFRVYPSIDYTVGGPTSYYRYKDFIMNGTVSAIPESGTSALIIGCLAGLFASRRRFR